MDIPAEEPTAVRGYYQVGIMWSVLVLLPYSLNITMHLEMLWDVKASMKLSPKAKSQLYQMGHFYFGSLQLLQYLLHGGLN